MPIIGLLLGIFFYKEPFDKIQSISFLIIWVGLVVFTMGEGKRERRVRIEDKT